MSEVIAGLSTNAGCAIELPLFRPQGALQAIVWLEKPCWGLSYAGAPHHLLRAHPKEHPRCPDFVFLPPH